MNLQIGSTMEDILVDWMSQGKSATIPLCADNPDYNHSTPYTPVHILQWPLEASVEVFERVIKHIRALMSRGQAVAIVGVPNELSVDWVEADIAYLTTGRPLFLAMPITWQSKHTTQIYDISKKLKLPRYDE